MVRRKRRSATWTEYVRSVIDPHERQIDIARRCDIDQTTISRWLNEDRPADRITSSSVAKFARGYGRGVLEAFVAAGFLTEDEADIKINNVIDWRRVSDRELLDELNRRMGVDELDERIVDGIVELREA